MQNNKTKFTPAPWYKRGKKVFWTKPDKDLPQDNLLNGCVCICATTEDEPPEVIEEAKANAALISAAPEMYALLERLSHALFAEDANEWAAEIKSLLAKANGGLR